MTDGIENILVQAKNGSFVIGELAETVRSMQLELVNAGQPSIAAQFTNNLAVIENEDYFRSLPPEQQETVIQSLVDTSFTAMPFLPELNSSINIVTPSTANEFSSQNITENLQESVTYSPPADATVTSAPPSYGDFTTQDVQAFLQRAESGEADITANQLMEALEYTRRKITDPEMTAHLENSILVLQQNPENLSAYIPSISATGLRALALMPETGQTNTTQTEPTHLQETVPDIFVQTPEEDVWDMENPLHKIFSTLENFFGHERSHFVTGSPGAFEEAYLSLKTDRSGKFGSELLPYAVVALEGIPNLEKERRGQALRILSNVLDMTEKFGVPITELEIARQTLRSLQEEEDQRLSNLDNQKQEQSRRNVVVTEPEPEQPKHEVSSYLKLTVGTLQNIATKPERIQNDVTRHGENAQILQTNAGKILYLTADELLPLSGEIKDAAQTLGTYNENGENIVDAVTTTSTIFPALLKIPDTPISSLPDTRENLKEKLQNLAGQWNDVHPYLAAPRDVPDENDISNDVETVLPFSQEEKEMYGEDVLYNLKLVEHAINASDLDVSTKIEKLHELQIIARRAGLAEEFKEFTLPGVAKDELTEKLIESLASISESNIDRILPSSTGINNIQDLMNAARTNPVLFAQAMPGVLRNYEENLQSHRRIKSPEYLPFLKNHEKFNTLVSKFNKEALSNEQALLDAQERLETIENIPIESKILHSVLPENVVSCLESIEKLNRDQRSIADGAIIFGYPVEVGTDGIIRLSEEAFDQITTEIFADYSVGEALGLSRQALMSLFEQSTTLHGIEKILNDVDTTLNNLSTDKDKKEFISSIRDPLADIMAFVEELKTDENTLHVERINEKHNTVQKSIEGLIGQVTPQQHQDDNSIKDEIQRDIYKTVTAFLSATSEEERKTVAKNAGKIREKLDLYNNLNPDSRINDADLEGNSVIQTLNQGHYEQAEQLAKDVIIPPGVIEDLSRAMRSNAISAQPKF